MTLKEMIESLPDNGYLLVSAPAIEHMITGTRTVAITRDGVIHVLYEDMEEEERLADDEILSSDADNPNLLSFVSFVQYGRPK